MSVNGISNQYAAAQATVNQPKTETSKSANAKSESAKIKKEQVSAPKETTDESGVIYESSSSESNKIYKQENADMIQQLKADAEKKTEQLRKLVESMITKQGGAIASADDMWKFLASGDFTVDAETKAQAQKDIAADGYWGVDQTSERILSFAKALTGGDSTKIESMRDAFKKGFEEATKTWGGELPEISKQTYDAVMEKFDQWQSESDGTAE